MSLALTIVILGISIEYIIYQSLREERGWCLTLVSPPLDLRAWLESNAKTITGRSKFTAKYLISDFTSLAAAGSTWEIDIDPTPHPIIINIRYYFINTEILWLHVVNTVLPRLPSTVAMAVTISISSSLVREDLKTASFKKKKRNSVL